MNYQKQVWGGRSVLVGLQNICRVARRGRGGCRCAAQGWSSGWGADCSLVWSAGLGTLSHSFCVFPYLARQERGLSRWWYPYIYSCTSLQVFHWIWFRFHWLENCIVWPAQLQGILEQWESLAFPSTLGKDSKRQRGLGMDVEGVGCRAWHRTILKSCFCSSCSSIYCTVNIFQYLSQVVFQSLLVMEPLIKWTLVRELDMMIYDENNCFRFGEGIEKRRAKTTCLSFKLFAIIPLLWHSVWGRQARYCGSLLKFSETLSKEYLWQEHFHFLSSNIEGGNGNYC